MGSTEDSEFPNVWPDSQYLPEFKPIMERAFAKHHECLKQVLECVAMGIGVPEDLFVKKHHRQEHEFRLLHYPEAPANAFEEGSGNIRIAEHSDFGTLTFLLQDGVGGLCVEDQQDERVFHPVTSELHEAILNVGDCLQRWTGGLFKSANHKVTAPTISKVEESQDPIPERFSVAFFGKPDRKESVGVLPELLRKSSLSYDDITAGEYNMQKLVRTY
jgi:isopenicillin N synthase-like dioxygenase